MRSARQLTLSAMGAIVAAAGFEHGVGEMIQGPVPPPTLMIQSWPHSEFYRSLDGEPAMTVIPNLLASGVITMVLSVALFVWMIRFVARRRSASVIASLSIALLFAGGGFGPPVLGLILAGAALGANSPLPWWRKRCPPAGRRILAGAWSPLFAACIAAWFAMLVGVPAMAYFFGIDSDALLLAVLATAVTLLSLALVSSFAKDAERGAEGIATGHA